MVAPWQQRSAPAPAPIGAEHDRLRHPQDFSGRYGLAFAVSMSVLSAQPSFAFGAEAQQTYVGDAFRFCSSDIPNFPAITACMYKHRPELSSGCCAIMNRGPAAKGNAAASN